MAMHQAGLRHQHLMRLFHCYVCDFDGTHETVMIQHYRSEHHQVPLPPRARHKWCVEVWIASLSPAAGHAMVGHSTTGQSVAAARNGRSQLASIVPYHGIECSQANVLADSAGWANRREPTVGLGAAQRTPPARRTCPAQAAMTVALTVPDITAEPGSSTSGLSLRTTADAAPEGSSEADLPDAGASSPGLPSMVAIHYVLEELGAVAVSHVSALLCCPITLVRSLSL